MSYDQINKARLAENMKLTYGFQYEELEKAKKMEGEDPCWDGYEMQGFKEKDGKRVPNCVPKNVKKSDEEEEFEKAQKPSIKEGEKPITLIHNKTKQSIQGVWRTMNGNRVFVSSDGKMEIAPDHVKEKYSESGSGSKGEKRLKDFQEKDDKARASLSKEERAEVRKEYFKEVEAGKTKDTFEEYLDKKVDKKSNSSKETESNSNVADWQKESIQNALKDRPEVKALFSGNVQKDSAISALSSLAGMRSKFIEDNWEEVSKIARETKTESKGFSKKSDKELKEMSVKELFEENDRADSFINAQSSSDDVSEVAGYTAKVLQMAAKKGKGEGDKTSRSKLQSKLDSKFSKIAKEAKSATEFFEEARKIQVDKEVGDLFFAKFGKNGKISQKQAAQNYIDYVKNKDVEKSEALRQLGLI